jgi:hypothetical protein
MNKRQYHHLGLVATQPMEGEYHIENWKVSLTPYDDSEFHLQWCRYHDGCPLPELVKTVPHVAFIVDDLDQALEGKKVIYGPFCPIENWRVAFIEECGAPVELIETSLTESQVKHAERIAAETNSLLRDHA